MSDYPPAFICLECGVNTGSIGHYYMLNNALWRDVNPKGKGMLCLDCVEKRLGRPLYFYDFQDILMNELEAKSSPDLARRFYRYTLSEVAK